MSNKTVTLRVNTAVTLPHKLSKAGREYIFIPDCDVPEKLAESLRKTYPGRYEVAKGKADVDKYTFKESFKEQSIVDIFSKLDEENQVEVFELAQELLKKQEDIKLEAEAAEKEKQILETRKKQEEEAAARRKADEESKRKAAGGSGKPDDSDDKE